MLLIRLLLEYFLRIGQSHYHHHNFHNVELALRQMTSLKPPSLNGFAACFYQHLWKTIENEVSAAILDILHGKAMHPTINFTFIALILKNDNPYMVSDFRLVYAIFYIS